MPRLARLARAVAVALVAAAAPRASAQTHEQQVAAAKLREFCRACHAVGRLRFIFGEDDERLWASLFTTRAPGSGRLWAEGIVEVLDWPSDRPPAFDELLDPPARDWMPKGGKRLDLAADRTAGEPTRRLILRALRDGLGEGGLD